MKIAFGSKEVFPTPAAENMFAAGEDPKLDSDRSQNFHTFVAKKALFACKRASLDIGTASSTTTMATCIQSPKKIIGEDWWV